MEQVQLMINTALPIAEYKHHHPIKSCLGEGEKLIYRVLPNIVDSTSSSAK